MMHRIRRRVGESSLPFVGDASPRIQSSQSLASWSGHERGEFPNLGLSGSNSSDMDVNFLGNNNNKNGIDMNNTKPKIKKKPKLLIIWFQNQWKNGDLRDKAVLILLGCLLMASTVWLIHYLVTPLSPISVTVAGQKRPIFAGTDTTIHVPMENIPLEEPPSMVLFRFLEGFSRRKLRRTGESALIQFGDQIRELMSLGSESFAAAFSSSSSSFDQKSMEYKNIDPYKGNLFRKKIKEMAPWLRGDPTQPQWPFDQLPPPSKDPKSQAVVICAGDKQMPYLEALLYTIRNVHQSNIPIRIVYQGDPDLSPKNRLHLQDLYNKNAKSHITNRRLVDTTSTTTNNLLQFIDLTKVFNLDPDRVQLRGWNLKPFGMLAVPESQVVLLDVDVLLLQPPEALFRQNGFLQTGALFFRDRSHGENLWTPRQFLLSMQPRLSQQAQKALVNGNITNEHIQEAGVVLIDKSRRWKGLWTACLILGRWDVRRFIQRDLIYGDKEVYFSAFETIYEPYAFAAYYPGVIGNVLSDFHGDDIDWNTHDQDDESPLKNVHLHIFKKTELLMRPYMALCGRMLHFDDQGSPLWSNGGYLTREDDRSAKDDVASRGLKPILFADGGDSRTESGLGGKERNQNWLFNHDLGVLCLFPNKREVRHVPNDVAEKAQRAVDFYVKNWNAD